MPRRLRRATGGLAYHVLNRGVGRSRVFAKEADYAAFEEVLAQACGWQPMRILSDCLMPNHWHLVLWPREDGELSEFMRWLTVTHTQRWHAHRQTSGTGPVYQGRFKSFPIQQDHHLLRVCRYVERNALRAGLVERAEEWRWSSLWRREAGHAGDSLLLGLDRWPVSPPRDWVACVNRAETGEEVDAIRRSTRRGAPFGEPGWQRRTAARLAIEQSLRPIGRPRSPEAVGTGTERKKNL